VFLKCATEMVRHGVVILNFLLILYVTSCLVHDLIHALVAFHLPC
jgi:hypothetical protein